MIRFLPCTSSSKHQNCMHIHPRSNFLNVKIKDSTESLLRTQGTINELDHEPNSSFWLAHWCSSHGYRHHHPPHTGSTSSGLPVAPSAWMATGSCSPPWSVGRQSWSHEQDPQCRWCCACPSPDRTKVEDHYVNCQIQTNHTNQVQISQI